MNTMNNEFTIGAKQFLTKGGFFEFESNSIEKFEEIEGRTNADKVFAIVNPQKDSVSFDYVTEHGFQFYYVTYQEETENGLAQIMNIVNSADLICDYNTLFETDNYVKIYPCNIVPFLKRRSELSKQFK